MNLLDLAAQIKARINQGAANGLNKAAQVILKDIQDHVQVRSGALRDSYAVTKQATPDDLSVEIKSPLAEPGLYGARHYPPTPLWIAEERNRALQQGDALFEQESDNEKAIELIRQSMRDGIQEEFRNG